MALATRSILFTVALVVLMSTTAGLRSALDRQARGNTDSDGPIYLPRAEFLRPLSLGYHNVLADILWFRAISYFGEHYRSDRTYPWLAHICELVTDLDPQAEHVYRFAGLILPWEAGDIEGGIAILEKGTRAIPQSWELAYYLGFTHFFFKNDFPTAARHLRRAATLPGAHPGTARLAAILTTEAAGPATTMAFLRDLEQNLDSPQVRGVLQRNLRETAAAAALASLNNAIAAYTSAAGEPPRTLEQVVAAGHLRSIPIDPFGGKFEIGPDGQAHSDTGKHPPRAHTSEIRQRVLQGNSRPAPPDREP